VRGVLAIIRRNMIRNKWQLMLLTVISIVWCTARASGSRQSRQLTQGGGADIAAVKEQHMQPQHTDHGNPAAGTVSISHSSAVNNYDDYALNTLVREGAFE
jgi:hypothetical protein